MPKALATDSFFAAFCIASALYSPVTGLISSTAYLEILSSKSLSPGISVPLPLVKISLTLAASSIGFCKSALIASASS